MSKYIIDTDKYYLHEFDGALIVMMHEGKPVSVYESKDNLEELNSDYINEHYGELQDEAYQKGYDAGIIESSFVDKSDEAYQRGLEDAWEAARKIVRMPEGDLLNIFTECYSAVCTALQVLLKYDASEAIAKLKAYEEHKDDSIKVGDIVEVYGNIGVVTYAYENTFDVMMYDGSSGGDWKREDLKKTGKHYDIQSILEAMRE